MKTDNELIAEFMDSKCIFDEKGFCLDPNHQYSWRPGCLESLQVIHLQYHNNWSWLMPVVERINKEVNPNMELRFWISYDGVFRASLGTKIYHNDIDGIKAIYRCVVEFIKWYNSQKQNA